ncbi:hypothetical protein FS749_005696 [Ceratobasidium sp. UAMH 11750]|nr:hypothetical protein FS749_005696 [Ceratobasidium sp. UAMH 11750]
MKFQAAGGAVIVLHSLRKLVWRDQTSQAITALILARLCLGVFYRTSSQVAAALSPLAQLLLTELLKLAISAAWWTHERKLTTPGERYIQLEDGDQPIASPIPAPRDDIEETPADSSKSLISSVPPLPLLGPLVGIAILNCAVGFSGVEAQRLAVPGALHIFIAVVSAVEVTAATFVLKYSNAVVVGVTSYSVSCALSLIFMLVGFMSHSLVIVIGLCISIYGLGMFITEQALESEDAEQTEDIHGSEEPSVRSAIALGIVGVVAIISTMAVSSQPVGKGLQSPQPTTWFDFSSLPPSQSKAWCPRRPLAKLSGRKHKQGARTSSAFDDILLVVFFSHPRYDINLPYHLEMYQDYFPNIVYVGPQTREDEGHKGVYDVLVDGFKSDEDLDGDWYKMAGRMAHHMLNTAMREHPCYDGYLWAPFDTFLNVPRLMQFRQDTIWWHSPFESIITYVDNPANKNSSRHAPPGNIQPGSAKDLIANYKHWGKDWWWGEPHVGLKTCMPAFQKASATKRSSLSKLTNGEPRMIGGSADTLYLPGYLRESFLETLDPFLDTDCFLEIAVPTAVHLIRPPSQKITFIDHWWIWEEPLNATFVRNQWSKGYEVDTFHKYKFGAKDENGHFHGDPTHISAVRDLLADSFRRQGMA